MLNSPRRFCKNSSQRRHIFVILSVATQRVARRKPQQKIHKFKTRLKFVDTSPKAQYDKSYKYDKNFVICSK